MRRLVAGVEIAHFDSHLLLTWVNQAVALQAHPTDASCEDNRDVPALKATLEDVERDEVAAPLSTSRWCSVAVHRNHFPALFHTIIQHHNTFATSRACCII